MILVATDASAFVCFITRFTEENFATLIAFIFIKKAFGKVAHIGDHYPINPSPCFCINNTIAEDPSIFPEFGNISQSFTFSKLLYNGTKKHYYPCEVCKLYNYIHAYVHIIYPIIQTYIEMNDTQTIMIILVPISKCLY